MEGPRSPTPNEWPELVSFLDTTLRNGSTWSITNEYPTALNTHNLHNIRVIADNNKIVSHALVKPIILKSPHIIYKLGAIGSVVTNPDYRHQGLSSQIIEACLGLAKEQSCDLAILWTDLFDFYNKFGFELSGYEYSFIIDRPLMTTEANLRFSSDSKIAAESIQRLYSNHTVASVRTLEEFKKFLTIPNTKIYTAWDQQGQLAAYAIEGKGVDLTGYIHEWGGSVSSLLSLFNYIHGIKKKPYTLIVPKHSENLIGHLKHYSSIMNEGYLGMLKIIDFEQLSTKIKRAFRAEGISDIVLEKQGEQYLFGCGADLYTMTSEREMVKLLFGPIHFDDLAFIKKETRDKLSTLLPLPLWVWGWDSV